jgi:hypothetical protein
LAILFFENVEDAELVLPQVIQSKVLAHIDPFAHELHAIDFGHCVLFAAAFILRLGYLDEICQQDILPLGDRVHALSLVFCLEVTVWEHVAKNEAGHVFLEELRLEMFHREQMAKLNGKLKVRTQPPRLVGINHRRVFIEVELDNAGVCQGKVETK